MTAPTPGDKHISAKMLLISMMTDFTISAIEETIPENEHAAITMPLRDWVMFSATIHMAMEHVMRTTPLLFEDNLVKRGFAAYKSIDAKIMVANRAAADRCEREGKK